MARAMSAWRTTLMCLMLLLGAWAATLKAQVSRSLQSATFDVSVVRLSHPDEQNSNLNLGKDQLQAQNLTLQSLMQFAYKLASGSDDQIVGGPKWMKSTRFDVNGKLDADTAAQVSRLTDDQRLEVLRDMLKSLLAQRFHLKVQHELRTIPVVEMQALGATKLTRFTPPVNGSSDAKGWQGLHNDGHGHIEGRGIDLKTLASVLAYQPEIGGRLVVDQTGIPESERFTFDLKWTPEKLDGTITDTSGPSGLSLFAAMQEQLGLKLTAGKAPVDVVVIDHAEMPDDN